MLSLSLPLVHSHVLISRRRDCENNIKTSTPTDKFITICPIDKDTISTLTHDKVTKIVFE